MSAPTELRTRETVFTPSTIHIITAAVWAGVIAVLQTLSMLGFGISAVIVTLQLAVSLYVVSGLWFGVWGILGSVIGMIIGNLIGGLPLSTTLLFQMCTVFECSIIMWAFRKFKCDVRLRNFKSIAVFIISETVVSAITSLWSAWYVVLGQTPPQFWITAVLPGWFLGSAIGRAILGTLALLVLSPFIMKFRGYVPNDPDRWIA